MTRISLIPRTQGCAKACAPLVSHLSLWHEQKHPHAAAAAAPLLYGSANLPPSLICLVSGSAFETAVDEIEAGRYPDMHLVYPSPDASATAPSNALSSPTASYAGVRVYVGSQAAAGVPEKSGKQNLEQWRSQKLAELHQSRISVILCCCNDGASALWKPYESSGIRFVAS